MAVEQFTYQQLDSVLQHLGFRLSYTTDPKNRKWRYYEHPGSKTEIILMDQKPTAMIRPSDAVSARRHLIEKGLVSEEELNQMLMGREEERTAGKRG